MNDELNERPVYEGGEHSTGWSVVPLYWIDRYSETHVIPEADARFHIMGPDCWCEPHVEVHGVDLVVHNSADEREKYERGEKKYN